jgi:hypothetical protein
MLRIALALALTVAAGAAYAQFNRCGNGFCPGSMFGDGFRPPGGSIALTNLRITNTGDFRITNTTDNRAVSP